MARSKKENKKTNSARRRARTNSHVKIDIVDSAIQTILGRTAQTIENDIQLAHRVFNRTSFWGKRRSTALNEISKLTSPEERKRYIGIYANLNIDYSKLVVMVAPRDPYPKKQPKPKTPNTSPAPRKEPKLPDEWNFE